MHFIYLLALCFDLFLHVTNAMHSSKMSCDLCFREMAFVFVFCSCSVSLCAKLQVDIKKPVCSLEEVLELEAGSMNNSNI